MPSQSPRDPRTSAEERLKTYLRSQAADDEFFFKSKFIAGDVGLSPSQIGALLGRLEGSVEDLEIERWSYSNATTWRVTRST